MKKFGILLLVLAFGFTITHTVHAQITPGDPGNFITTWQTNLQGTSDSNQIIIPTTGTGYNYDIYWQNLDNAAENGTITGIEGSTTITFPQEGRYRVEIAGSFPRIFFNNSGDRRKILSVEQWGEIKWDSMIGAFFGAQNLVVNASDAPDLSSVSSLQNMFRGASSLAGNLNHWNVSGITDMEFLFNNATNFNGELSEWNVSSVTNMRSMFQNASSFNQDITMWDVSNVEIMTNMFQGASLFNQDIGYDQATGVGWDVRKVTIMNGMFNGATSFNGDISGWVTSSLTSISSMFRGATRFNIDIGGWDVSNVSGGGMQGAFWNASDFNQDLTNWDVSNVTNMSTMFMGATSFNGDLSGWDTQNVQLMGNMFSGARSFNRDISMWDVSSVTAMNAMFQNADSFNQDIIGYDPDTGTGWDVSKVTNMSFMFNNAAAFNGDISGWNTGSVTNMQSMFGGATAFNADISKWNTGNVTSFFSTFSGAASFNSDIGNWDVESVSNMQGMFSGAAVFNQDISGWTVSNVTNMNSMFNNANSFDQSLGDWNIEKVTGMLLMLNNSGLSTENYDATLTGWSQQNVNSGVTLSATGLTYCAENARNLLISKGWTINGDSLGNCTLLVDADNSDAEATSPHIADGVDASLVTVKLVDEAGQPVSGLLNSDFVIGLTGSAVTSDVTETEFDGVYTFSVTNTVEESVTVTITADGIQLTVQPQIIFNAPAQVVDASNSDAEATSPHIADGVDASLVTVKLADEADQPVSGLLNSDFVIGLTGSAVATDVTETATPGTYSFTVTNTVEESVTVTITADGTELTQKPVILFENEPAPPPPPTVSASNSTVSATSPHLSDGIDASTVTIILRDQSNNPFTGLTNSSFNLNLTGSASSTSVTESATAGTYTFSVTNTVEESVTVTITAGGVELTQQPIILFEEDASPPPPPPVVVSADNSSVTATSPHLADGSDASTVTIILRDESNEPIPGFTNDDFLIDLEGIGEATNAQSTDVTETSTPGTYRFQVTNVTEDIVTVYVRADFVDLSDTPEIVFEEAATAGDAFITTWRTNPTIFPPPGASADNQIRIPMIGNGYNFTVHWGDGSSETYTANPGEDEFHYLEHTYPSTGIYQVSITGDFPRIYFSGSSDSGKILSVDQWGSIQWTSMAFAFDGAFNLASFPQTEAPDLSNVESMERMLRRTRINSDLTHWDVSNVTNMRGLFEDATFFNGDISNWNVSNVTDMSYMFQDAVQFNGDIQTKEINVDEPDYYIAWDVSNVVTMANMFSSQEGNAFNSEISEWDVSSVEDMSAMFSNATSFNQDIGGWDVSSVTNMEVMFFGARSFDADISGWNTANLNSMFSMFEGAESFDQSLGGWDVSGVPDMSSLFNFSNLSRENYDATLIGWAAQDLESDVTLGAGGRTYCATDARNILVSDFNWNIQGDALAADCSSSAVPFVTTWKTNNSGASANNQIRIPMIGNGYNFTIDWGDGNSESYDINPGESEEHYLEHTYAVAGEYTVSISGEFPRIYFNRSGDNAKIISIDQWGDIEWVSMENAFSGTWNLNTIHATDAPDLSSVASMKEMFSESGNFNTDLNHWDVSNVTDMSHLFEYLIFFNGDISDWDVSNVTDMSRMFNGAVNFNMDIGYDLESGQGWDVSNVKDMSYMFSSPEGNVFNADITGWDVSSVENMEGMFDKTTYFNQNIGGWDVSSVTNMSGMFFGAIAFNADISGWNTSSLITMGGMFYSASGFNQNIGGWNVSNVTDMADLLNFSGMLRENYDAMLIGWSAQDLQNNVELGAFGQTYCAEAARSILINTYNWDILGDELAEDCPASFEPFVTNWKTDNTGPSGDEQIRIPLIGNGYNFTVDWGDGNVSTYSENPGEETTHFIQHTYTEAGEYTVSITGSFPRIYFNNEGDRLKILTIEQWGDIAWSSMENAFNGAFNLVHKADDAPDLSGVTSLRNMFRMAFVNEAEIGGSLHLWDVGSITDMSGTFYQSEVTGNITGWNTGNVLDMSNMFYGSVTFNGDISGWNTQNVENMAGMFTNAISFNRDISSWQTGKVTSMNEMFYNADTFNQPLISWNTENVTDFSYMFAYTSEFDQDLDNWDTSSATTMEGMFEGTRAFDGEIGSWNTSNVENMLSMFVDAEKFNRDIRTKIMSEGTPDEYVAWDVSNVKDMTLMFAFALLFDQNIGNWNTGSVEIMDSMFQGAESFNQDIGEWDVSSVADMSHMFEDAAKFNQDLSGWQTSNVATMRSMFRDAVNFNQSLANWDVTNTEDMALMLNSSGLSRENYDLTLEGWAAQTVKEEVALGAAGRTYCAVDARDILTDTYNWTITGDEPAEDCTGPVQIVDAENSSVSATSPHLANGIDTSVATVILRDEDDLPITGLEDGDFMIELTGSAVASEVVETGTPGTYTFTITNIEIETVTLTVIADGVELDDQPEIVFEAAVQIVDAGNSSVSATSPHIADGVDTSVATVVLRDESDEPITGLINDDFEIELTGSAMASGIEETGTPGTYTFTITNNEIETISLKVTVQGVELDDQPQIEFEGAEQIVDAAASSTSATSPHFSDGVDASVVTIVVIDTEGDPISGIDPEEFVLNHSGVGLLSGISETDAPGTYKFAVTSDTPGSASVKIGVRGVALADVGMIFIKPVDPRESIVSATSPHVADGEDAATVTVTVANEDRELFDGLENDDFLIELTGSALATEVTESESGGVYSFTVTNAVAETVTVSITVLGVELDGQPEIIFEEPVQIPDAENSSVTASSPQIIDNIKTSTVTVVLRDENDQPIPGRTNDDFDIEVTGSAVITSISESDTPGTYRFIVTNTEEEIITVSVTADGIELNDQPEIDFISPPQVPDAGLAKITATSPHLADGEDTSEVLISLVDGDSESITGFVNDDFDIQLSGSAVASAVNETATLGVYTFTVTNTIAETVTVTVKAGGVELDNQPKVEFEAPPQIVDADNSSVSATSPHLADGEDLSVVTILLRDQNDEPITGFKNTDFDITLSGSAVASEVTETDIEGTYQFTVTSEIAEIITVIVTADGVELSDKPEIDFESLPQVVDAQRSFISATTPHIANGSDESEVSVFLRDEKDEIITGFVPDDFVINLSGSATVTSVTETNKPGTYTFGLSSTVAGTVSVTVIAGGITINKRAFIVFEEPEIVVDVNGSSVSATSPHLADGEDFSTISIRLLDDKGDPISNLLPEDFDFDLPDGITASKISETNTPGTYELTVISMRPGTIDLKFIVLGFPLAQTAVIEFTEPDPVVDATNSEVTATTPHLADGEDASTVTLILRDEDNELISGVHASEFSIQVSGIASASSPVETGSGVYQFDVVSEHAGFVSITVIIFDVELNDKPEIEFEPVPAPIPDSPIITDLTGDASEVKITWLSMNLEYIQNFIIYRGESQDNLEPIGQATSAAVSFFDANPAGATLFYRISAVNTDGIEGGLSNVVTFFNSSIVADNHEWRLVSSPLETPVANQENITLFGFSLQYELSGTLEPTQGYWIKSRTFDQEVLPLTGSGLTTGAVNLRQGWNLIGSLSAPVAVSSITDESGILTSAPVFGFSPTGYAAVQTLLPNNGYWIYANGEGTINLHIDEQTEQGKQLAAKEVMNLDTPSTWIEFSDSHQSRRLWISDALISGEDEMKYILPPLPPGDLLDVRTAANVNMVDSHSERIHIRASDYPVTVSIHGLDEHSEHTWRFKMTYGADELTTDLLPGKPIQLMRDYDRIEMIKIRMDEAISVSRLLPNYPNPFNPTTTIQYQLRDQTHVRIEVFDTIGRRVQVLANEIQTSGAYKVNFDAGHLSTGMYIVRFVAGGESQIQKITLIK
ncbi:MAG: BspA family leucine-rich repeat surface protein [Balneolaceae bacterium]|nr:MAG: BspA family leucine-rich repeat surface protein [Balneolaceae bacterium]